MNLPKFTLDEALDLRELQTTGSTLHINQVYDETDATEDFSKSNQLQDLIGKPVNNFKLLAETMTTVDSMGFVKKKILEEGGGCSLQEDCTVFIAYSGYYENSKEPFDTVVPNKPMEVDLKDNGLLPGLLCAIKSMLVGELSMFLLAPEVMYREMGILERIKANSNCIFYIKLIKCILTNSKKKNHFSEPNMFERVHKEVKQLYSSGCTLYKFSNIPLAIQSFRKAENMLHRCRLADEAEEKIQESLLKKLYINLALCYNKNKQPLKACTACNELNRLNSLWNNAKALFNNAIALRMIGDFDGAEKRLVRAMKLCPDMEEMKAESELLQKARISCNQSKLIGKNILENSHGLLSDKFKTEVDTLIRNFKQDTNLCKLILPGGLNADEMQYVKEACIRENLFFNKLHKKYLENNYETTNTESNNEFVLDKDKSSDDGQNDENYLEE